LLFHLCLCFFSFAAHSPARCDYFPFFFFQGATQRLFRATTEQHFPAPNAEHMPTDEEVLHRYIKTLGDLRVQVLEDKEEFKHAFITQGEKPEINVGEALRIVAKIEEHANMIGASDPASCGAMSDFVIVMVKDVEKIVREIQQIQQSMEEV
jgi:hypothetical protein